MLNKLEIPVNRIIKYIELEDLTIVRYKNPLIKKPCYRIYNNTTGENIEYGIHTYSELLSKIINIRNVNKAFNEILDKYFN